MLLAAFNYQLPQFFNDMLDKFAAMPGQGKAQTIMIIGAVFIVVMLVAGQNPKMMGLLVAAAILGFCLWLFMNWLASRSDYSNTKYGTLSSKQIQNPNFLNLKLRV